MRSSTQIDTVYAGSVVETGELTIRVTAAEGKSRYDRIVHMIEETEKLKSSIEGQAAHLADQLVPYTLGGAALTYLFTRNVNKMLSVLLVDFSCALKMAMPIAVLSAIREARMHDTTVEGKKTIMGSRHFVFEDEKCLIPEGKEELFHSLPAHHSHLFLAIENMLVGVICIEDPIRSEAAEVIRKLREVGFWKVVIMTGDSERTAACVAKTLGVHEYYSEVLPEDKANYILEQKALGRKVVMLGDGINDSPALLAADVGINGALITLGVGGMISPTASAMIHNTSTLFISINSMTNLLEEGTGK